MKFGAHVSIAGGINKAPMRAHEFGCECFQIFTRSPRGGNPPALNNDLVDSFFQSCEDYGFRDYYVHTPYYINFASENNEIRKSSIRIVIEELKRSDILNVKYVMTHLGSSKGMERAVSVKRVAEAVSEIIDSCNIKTELLLENSAGQGNTIGEKFEELADIIVKINHDSLGICLDTAHTFAAGYDIRDHKSLGNTLEEFNSTIGIDRLKLIHGNDSKAGLGDKKDRHEHIGKGKIGISGFESVIKDTNLNKLDMVIETPPEGIKNDLRILKTIRS